MAELKIGGVGDDRPQLSIHLVGREGAFSVRAGADISQHGDEAFPALPRLLHERRRVSHHLTGA